MYITCFCCKLSLVLLSLPQTTKDVGMGLHVQYMYRLCHMLSSLVNGVWYNMTPHPMSACFNEDVK